MEKELEPMEGPTLDTRPRADARTSEQPLVRDKHFVRRHHYEQDMRWFVNRSIAFGYEGQLATAISSIDHAVLETRRAVSQVEEISAHAHVCMERIKQNTLLHDAKLEDCKKELQEIGRLQEVNPNYELKYGKPGARKSPNRRGVDIAKVLPRFGGPALDAKTPAARKAAAAKPAARSHRQPTIESIQEQRKYNAYCNDFKRYLRHKNGEFTTVTDTSKTIELKKAHEKEKDKKRMKQMFDKTQAMAASVGDSLESGEDSEEDRRETGYLSMIRRHYSHILELPDITKTKSARRADIIRYFFAHPTLLKLHDFLPDHFILAVNEKECKNAHQLTRKKFCQLIEEPRDQVMIDDINRFFSLNPLQTSNERVTYYNLMTYEAVNWLKQCYDEFPRVRTFAQDVDDTMTPEQIKEQFPVNVCKFIRAIHEDEAGQRFLNSYAVYILPLNRLLTLSQVLIELDIAVKKRQDPAKFNLQWRELLAAVRDYRLSGHRLYFADYIPLKSRDDDRNSVETALLPRIREVFDSHADAEAIADLRALLPALQADPALAAALDDIVRRKAKIGRALHNETLRQVLARIALQADQFVDWNEFVQFFSKRGFPILDVYIAMLENSDDPVVENSIPGKMKKSKTAQKPPIRDPKYLWNIPHNRRKEILKARLSPKEFVAIFGRQFEPEFRDDGYHVTVPEPFDFGIPKPPTYRKILIEEMVAEQDQNYEIYRFKGKPIPPHVYQPIFRDMVEKEIKKKEDILRRRNEVLLLREQNLDLIKAEEERTNAWKEKWAYRDPPPFEANQLPSTNRVGLYDELVGSKIREMEQRRSLINKVRDERKDIQPNPYDYLPPRMAEHEQQTQLRRSMENAALAKKLRADLTFRPKLNHFPEDFDWEHYYKMKQDRFRASLDERKAAHAAAVELTAPKAFELHQSRPRRRGVKRVHLDASRAKSAPARRINWRREPALVPAMTKKFEQLVQANKDKRFLKHNQGVRDRLVADERKRRRAEFAKRVIYSPAIVAELRREQELRLRMEENRRYLREQHDDEYLALMEGIRHRVMSRPLLVEQGPYFDRGTNTYEEEEMEERMAASEGDIPEDIIGEQEEIIAQ